MRYKMTPSLQPMGGVSSNPADDSSRMAGAFSLRNHPCLVVVRAEQPDDLVGQGHKRWARSA